MILGKSMAGKMRFRQQTNPSDTTGPGELVPGCIADGMERERMGQLIKKRSQLLDIGQGRRVASVRFNYPLKTAHEL